MISGEARDAPRASADSAALPPGPRGSAWANFARYLRDPLATMDRYAADHGGVAYVRFPGGHSFFFVSDAELVRRVLVDDNAAFVKGRALQAARRLLGDGLLTSEGADHLRRRRAIQPVFRREHIDRYGDVMIDAAEHVCAGWADGAEVDINREMTRVALRIVGRTIFDADVESEAPEIAAVLDAGMRVFHRFLLPGAELLWRLPLPATRQFNAAKRDIDAFLERLVAEHEAAAEGSGDLVGVLLALREGDGARTLADAEIRDEAITLMLAGHETTAQALTWAWYLLARNPPARAALAAELAAVLGARPLETADFDRLPYTQAVFRETLRLYPPVWALARIATRPYELGPYRVPERGTIVTSQWVVQRRAEYFADPLRFAPERWLAGPAAAGGRLLPVRRRSADVHRRALRAARGDARARCDRAQVAGRARPGHAPHRRPLHAAPARRAPRPGAGRMTATAGFAARLAARAFVITSELVPPRGAEADAVRRSVADLAFADGVNITDLPRARPRMSALGAAAIAVAAGAEPILQMTCRDRNRIALAADALAAAAIGVGAVLPLGGDPLPEGVPGVAVGDLDAAGLVRLLTDLAAGILPDGAAVEGPPPRLLVGAAASPGLHAARVARRQGGRGGGVRPDAGRPRPRPVRAVGRRDACR